MQLGLVGSATNLSDGRVEVVAEGSRPACERLLQLLGSDQAPGTVRSVSSRYGPARGGLSGFTER